MNIFCKTACMGFEKMNFHSKCVFQRLGSIKSPNQAPTSFSSQFHPFESVPFHGQQQFFGCWNVLH